MVGLDHEHIRSDRDRFVSVNVDGVPNEYTQFYEKKKAEDLRTYDTPYDLQSIMHYGPGVKPSYSMISIGQTIVR